MPGHVFEQYYMQKLLERVYIIAQVSQDLIYIKGECRYIYQ